FQQVGTLLAIYVQPQWPKVCLLALLLASATGLQLAEPRVLGLFIDATAAQSPLGALFELALIFLLVALAGRGVAAGVAYVTEDVGWTATNRLREDLVLHCLRLDRSFHSAHTPGSLIERVDGDVTALTTLFSQIVLQVLGTGAMIVGVAVVLLIEDWRIGLPLTGYALVSIALLKRVQGIGVPHFRAARQLAADISGFLTERLVGTEDLRANGAVGYTAQQLERLLESLRRVARKSEVLGSAVATASVALYAVSVALVFGLGAWLLQAGAITVGMIYVIYRYNDLLTSNLRSTSQQLDELQRAMASLQRVNELYCTTSRIRDGRGAALPEGPLAIDLSDVSFAYDEGQPVLERVSLHLDSGRVLGLLGRTGSGKTTLGRLLFRFLDPTAGAVCLGGVDVRESKLSALRQRIALVTQEVQLFHGSLRDNLTFFDAGIADSRVTQAMHTLGLEDWLRLLPGGLDAEITPGRLSAGEAQLLTLARAYLKSPGLVILDEASSRLDPLTARLIERAIRELLTGCTAIVIAHRRETVERVDEVAILEAGRIVEHGERGRLAADPQSRFHHLRRAGIEEVLA
ncbi:MAG: ABC transporter ATP-binding protein/permease, partial [Chloroflexota bacterium]|nr:ABC transporter ATP-binding protein/permease [Chloroflexota bacterium]